MSLTSALSKKLNIVESTILYVEEWANVFFVKIKNLGCRFVSKKDVNQPNQDQDQEFCIFIPSSEQDFEDAIAVLEDSYYNFIVLDNEIKIILTPEEEIESVIYMFSTHDVMGSIA